ncbi:MAG: tRNA-intron lyase, partial [Promethearchaeota archaeon]
QNDKIIVENSPTAKDLHEKNFFGLQLPNNKYEFSIIEGLLLMERNRLKIMTLERNPLRSDEILNTIAQKDPQIWIRYLVYRDLRQRGYIVRLGYGDEIHFRIFSRGANPQTDIAKYFIFILEEDNAVRLDLLDKITKQSVNSRKILILATVDRLGDITYYQLEQFQLSINKNKLKNW